MVKQTLRRILVASNPRLKALPLHSTHPSPTSLRGRNYRRSHRFTRPPPSDTICFCLFRWKGVSWLSFCFYVYRFRGPARALRGPRGERSPTKPLKYALEPTPPIPAFSLILREQPSSEYVTGARLCRHYKTIVRLLVQQT